MHVCIQDGQEVVQDASCFDDKVNILRLQRDGSEEYAPLGCRDAKGIFLAPPGKKKGKSLIFIQADAMQYLPLNKSAEGLEALAGAYLGTA